MLLRTCWIGLAVVAVLALARGGYLSSTSTAPPAEWIIEEPDRDLGTLAVGTHTVEWRVTNRADSERSILGVAEG